jgi:hypothetical protein
MTKRIIACLLAMPLCGCTLVLEGPGWSDIIGPIVVETWATLGVVDLIKVWLGV